MTNPVNKSTIILTGLINIIFTLRGYSEAQASPEKHIEDYSKEHEHYIRDIDEYISVLRTVFYKEGQ